MPEVARRYRALLSERFATRHVQAATPAVEKVLDAGIPEAEPPFDLEAEINQLMFEGEEASKD
ncbi:hypothetical protein [Rhizobium giardinii]